MLENLIKILKKEDFNLEEKLIIDFNKSHFPKDSLYSISQLIFESPKINHKTRVKAHEEIIKIGKQKKCNFSIAHNLNLVSRIYSVLGQSNKSIKNDLEALKLWRSLKSEPLAINGEIMSYANLGNLYIDLGLYNKALDYYQNGLKKLKKCKNYLIPYVRIHLGLGNVYNRLKRYRKAEKFFVKAYNEAEKTKNDLMIIPCELSVIQTKMYYHDYKSVISKCKKIKNRLEKINDVNYQSHILSTMGNCYMNLKNYKDSEKYFLQNLNLNQTMHSTQNKASTLKDLGILYYKMKKFDKSLSFFEKSYNLYVDQKSIQSNFEIIKYLSLIYEKKGLRDKSLIYYKKYVKEVEKNNSEKDKLFKADKRRIITGLESELDEVKKEKENLEKEKHKNINKNSKISTSLIHSTNREFLESIIEKIKLDHFDKNKIIKDIKSKISDSMEWIDYLKAFEQLNSNFMTKMIKYKLSMTEIKICTFIRIGFDNYEISGIMGITLRGVQQHRYRITKKLNNKKKLDDFIFSI